MLDHAERGVYLRGCLLRRFRFLESLESPALADAEDLLEDVGHWCAPMCSVEPAERSAVSLR